VGIKETIKAMLSPNNKNKKLIRKWRNRKWRNMLKANFKSDDLKLNIFLKSR